MVAELTGLLSSGAACPSWGQGQGTCRVVGPRTLAPAARCGALLGSQPCACRTCATSDSREATAWPHLCVRASPRGGHCCCSRVGPGTGSRHTPASGLGMGRPCSVVCKVCGHAGSQPQPGLPGRGAALRGALRQTRVCKGPRYRLVSPHTGRHCASRGRVDARCACYPRAGPHVRVRDRLCVSDLFLGLSGGAWRLLLCSSLLWEMLRGDPQESRRRARGAQMLSLRRPCRTLSWLRLGSEQFVFALRLESRLYRVV